MKKRLAIITTHPIQYNAPWFTLLASRGNIELKVFYTWSQAASGLKFDPGFNKNVEWDIPLLEGYQYKFVENTSDAPGTRNYRGIVNPSLIQEVEDMSPDAILVFGWNFKSHLSCLRHFHKKGTLVLFRGDSTLIRKQDPLRNMLRYISLKWVYSHVNAALYVGKANKKYYLKYGLKEKQLFMARHAIDNLRFAATPDVHVAKAMEWRRTLNISASAVIFLYAGKFEAVKNPEFLLRASSAFEGNEEIHFIFLGNGPQEDDLRRKAGANVSFIDFQNQAMMPVVYRLGDVFVLPSLSETWGLSVNEAMACSRAVLVSDQCGCAPDLIEEGVNGFVFDLNEPSSLTEKINLFFKNKSLLKKMGEASLAKIQQFSFEGIVEKVEEVVMNNPFHK